MRERQPAGFITRPFTGRKRAVYGSQTGGLRAVNGRGAKTGRLWFAMKAAGVLSKKAGFLSKKGRGSFKKGCGRQWAMRHPRGASRLVDIRERRIKIGESALACARPTPNYY